MKNKSLIGIIISFCFIIGCVLPTYAINAPNEFVEYAPSYEYIHRTTSNTFIARDNSGYSILDFQGHKVANVSGDKFGDCKDGIYPFRNDGKWGYMSLLGEIIIEPQFDSASEMSNLTAIVSRDNKSMIINAYGDIIYTTPNIIIYNFKGETLMEYKDGKYSLYSIKDCLQIVSDIESPSIIADDKILFRLNGKEGLMDWNGKIIIEPNYEKIEYLETGYILANGIDSIDIFFALSGEYICSIDADRIYEIGYCGDVFCRSDGEWIIKNLYSEKSVTVDNPDIIGIDCGYENVYIVTYKDGKMTYCDEYLHRKTDLCWDRIYRFYNGVALVCNNVYDFEVNDYIEQWYIIDSSFSVIKKLDYAVYVDPFYQASTDFTDGYVRTLDQENKLMGLVCLEDFNVNADCRLILAPSSIYQIKREEKMIVGVDKGIAVSELKMNFLNHKQTLTVLSPNGSEMEDFETIVDGCKIVLNNTSDYSVVLDELMISVSEEVSEIDPPITDPNNSTDPGSTEKDPNTSGNDADIMDYVNSIADKIGVTSDQLLMIAGGSLAALVLLIIVIAAIRRRRY